MRMENLLVCIVVTCSIAMGGCEAAESRTTGRDANEQVRADGGMKKGGDGDGNSVSDTDGDVEGDGGLGDPQPNVCEEFDFPVELQPVRIMILQDMSGSMGDSDDPASKWSQAKDALKAVLNNPANIGIEFGFDIFPNGSGSCPANAPVVADCGVFDNKDIAAGLDLAEPSGSTPECKAMANFKDPTYAPGCTAAEVDSYLIVVSDGRDGCDEESIGCDGSDAAFGAMSSALHLDHDIKTFAIGFGNQADTEQLNAIAMNGGTSAKKYISANSTVQLQTALDSIATTVASCKYEVKADSDDIDLTNVKVYQDDKEVPFDDGCGHGVGWTWSDDTNEAIELCEEACAQLSEGAVLSTTFGCKPVFVV